MTGIRTTEKEIFYDLPFERYEKCSQVPKKYSIIQAGISVFQKNGDQYLCHPYNAFTIQRKIPETSFVPDISLESGAIRFNAEHGMNFNTWIKEGVSFLDRETQDSLVEEVKKRNDNQVKHIISRIEQAVGFTKFFELISQRGVPVIGHNCYMDLLFLHNSYIGQLPQSYAISEEDEETKEKKLSYKETFHRYLPYVFDSKTMANAFLREHMHEGETSTSLENIKEFIYKDLPKYRKVKVTLAPGCEDYDWDIEENGKKFHEAGFDSYLTGWTFLQLREFYLGQGNSIEKFNKTFLNQVNLLTNRFLLSLSTEEDQLQSSVNTHPIDDEDNLFILHSIKNRKEDVEKVQKDILEFLGAKGYDVNFKSSILNQEYIFIEFFQQKNDKIKTKEIKERINGDLVKFQEHVTTLNLHKYQEKVFQAKSAGKGRKFGNNNKGPNKFQDQRKKN